MASTRILLSRATGPDLVIEIKNCLPEDVTIRKATRGDEVLQDNTSTFWCRSYGYHIQEKP
jgi:hypothetical protein